MKRALIAILAILALGRTAAASKTAAPQGDLIAKGKAFFQHYVELEHAFDPSIADLYSDQATIKSNRHLPDGKIVPMTIPAGNYKQALRNYMTTKARQIGDVSNYTNDTYSLEGANR